MLNTDSYLQPAKHIQELNQYVFETINNHKSYDNYEHNPNPNNRIKLKTVLLTYILLIKLNTCKKKYKKECVCTSFHMLSAIQLIYIHTYTHTPTLLLLQNYAERKEKYNKINKFWVDIGLKIDFALVKKYICTNVPIYLDFTWIG